MSAFNKMLIPTDFSDISDRAFFSAVDLTKQLGGSLHVVHIMQIHPTSIPETGKVDMDEIRAIEEKRANESLDKLIAEHGEGIEISKAILHGDPVTEINKVAKEIHADMIVMGTHGRTGVAHLMMGSVAESVLRNAEVPVMCIRGI